MLKNSLGLLFSIECLVELHKKKSLLTLLLLVSYGCCDLEKAAHERKIPCYRVHVEGFPYKERKKKEGKGGDWILGTEAEEEKRETEKQTDTQR